MTENKDLPVFKNSRKTSLFGESNKDFPIASNESYANMKNEEILETLTLMKKAREKLLSFESETSAPITFNDLPQEYKDILKEEISVEHYKSEVFKFTKVYTDFLKYMEKISAKKELAQQLMEMKMHADIDNFVEECAWKF